MRSALHDLQDRYYPVVRSTYVESGATERFIPCSCGADGSCNIKLNGYVNAGWILTLEGPRRFEQQQYMCTTHHTRFCMTEPVFVEWLYGSTSPYTWQEVQPEPLFVKYGVTYYTSSLLADVVSQFENRVTINQIVQNIQQRWKAVWSENRAAFLRHAAVEDPGADVGCIPDAATPYWVHLRQGKNIMIDRSKVQDLLLSYFGLFLEDQYDRDCITACERLSYGISIDETFKVSLKCSIAVEKDPNRPAGVNNIKYEAVSYCFQTIHSSLTQMLVHSRFMPDKSAAEKRIGVLEVLERQRAAEQAGRPAQPTLFIATDSPPADNNMLQAVHKQVFPAGHAAFGQLDVGDDCWHAYWRIGKFLPAKQLAMHQSLKAVFHLIYKKAATGDMQPADAVTNGRELSKVLSEWAAKWKLSAAAKDAVRACKQNTKWLFTFLPHVDHLVRYGTTANEHGHWCINRKLKFTSHMRPDHTKKYAKYVFFLHDAACAEACTANYKLSDEQRALCSELFVRPEGIPFERLAAQHKPPFIIPLERIRIYTAADDAEVCD